MTAKHGSRFLAFFIGVITALVLTVFTASIAHADDMEPQADGATITSPDDGKTYDLGKSVTVKAKAPYTRPDGQVHIPVWPNYIYLRIMKDDVQVGDLLKKDFTGYSGSSTTVTLPSFTPATEGEYVLEVHHDYTYDNGNHVELDPANFVADHSRTIIVQKILTNDNTTVSAPSMTYTSQPLTPAPTVVTDGKTLSPETDYDVSYSEDTVNVGVVTVTITGKGFYKGTVTGTFTITPADISQATMSGVVDKDYSPRGATQTPTITWNDQTLVADTDYELSYADNDNAGTATVTAQGKGNFTGSLSAQFTVNRVSICSLGNPRLDNKTSTGQPITQSFTFWHGGTVEEGVGFTTSYENNVNPGTATVTITGIGNFKDSMVRTFSILEPSPSAGFGALVTAPNDQTQFDVGSTITVSAKAGIFENSVTWVGGSGPYVTTSVNLMYVRVLRRDGTTGTTETVKYERLEYHSSEVVSTDFTADVAGEYLIQVQRQGIRVNFETNKFIFVEESDFAPQDSITVYVGVEAPGAKTSISNAQISGVTDKYYTGDSVTQNPTVKLNGKTLSPATDYYITYSGMYSGGANIYDPGTVTMTIHGKGDYVDTVSATYQILPKPITADMIVMTPASAPYTGELQKPSVTVMNGFYQLNETVHFNLVNEGGTKPGQYAVTATALNSGRYTGSATAYFTIDKWSIDQAIVKVNPTSYVYDGTAKKPAVASVTLNGETLPSDVYTVSYSNNTNAGTAKATVTAKSSTYYAGTASTTFKITPASIADATISGLKDATYTGSAITQPSLTVKLGGKTLVAGTDYTVSYSDNVNVGTATATVTGKGNYKDTAKSNATFKITPKAATITVDNATKGVGSPDPAFTGMVKGLVADGDLGTVKYSRTNTTEAVGTYKGVLTATYTANPNYSVTVTNGDFTIKKGLTVIWMNGDGTELSRALYDEGASLPAYTGKTPTKAATAKYTYVFAGWDNGTVSGTTTTFKPLFTAKARPASDPQPGQETNPGSGDSPQPGSDPGSGDSPQPGRETNPGSGDSPQPGSDPAKPGDSADRAWTRLAGDSAFATMSSIVDAGKFAKGGTVVLASLEGYWDALTAAGIAGLENAPVLMALQDSLGDQTTAQLAKLAPAKIVVCGGAYWIPDTVVNMAKAAAGTNPQVVRLAGAVAVNTAEDIAKAGKGRWSDTAIIATVGTFQDALAAAPVSYAKAMPIYLAQFDFVTEKGSLAKTSIDSMKANGITRVYIAGGTYWLPTSIEEQLASAGISVVKRLSGDTAVETSAAIAAEATSVLGFSANDVGLANVAQHYDALASAAFCGKNASVLLLASDTKRSSIDSFVKKNGAAISHGYVFGGTGSVSPDTMAYAEKAAK